MAAGARFQRPRREDASVSRTRQLSRNWTFTETACGSMITEPMPAPLSSTAAVVAVLILFGSTHAAAQAPYVGAAVLTDVVRSSGTRDQQPGDGETIGGALRVGTSLGERWGVELEFVRSGETDWRPDVTILAGATSAIFPTRRSPFQDCSTRCVCDHTAGDVARFRRRVLRGPMEPPGLRSSMRSIQRRDSSSRAWRTRSI
jgi:hypothetical protein